MIQNREIFQTADGSKTFYIPELNEYYHSHHGAIQEAIHVFIDNGLKSLTKNAVSILEVGFGTGLNTLLTLGFSNKNNLKVDYTGVEAFPLSYDEALKMDYTHFSELNHLVKDLEKIHKSQWGEFTEITDRFKLNKIQNKLQNLFLEKESFDIVYFDAFGPRVQPEMWILSVFEQLNKSLKPNGIFVTYCAKGQVKRDLKTAGFTVETLPGPPGKREMIRAIKM